MPTIDYDEARAKLAQSFALAESEFFNTKASAHIDSIQPDIEAIFASNTQAYREVLLGCVLAKLAYPSIDITKPYISQSDSSFNGRTLDERVVNPFLNEKRVPSSKGPYLSTFRRSVDFSPATRAGVRDKTGYDALLSLIHHIKKARPGDVQAFLVRLLASFIQLREHATIPVAKLNRISLIQYQLLIDGLLSVASGGRIPVMLLTAMFSALQEHFSLAWKIESQGINQADSASRAGGDITIRKEGKIVLVAEVTERVVDKSRVVSTFNTKISPEAIEDYIFFVNNSIAHEPAIAQAAQYFAQGSEVNFVDIRSWLGMSLVTLGKNSRAEFNEQLRMLLDSHDTPRVVKVAWNNLVANLTSV